MGVPDCFEPGTVGLPGKAVRAKRAQGGVWRNHSSDSAQELRIDESFFYLEHVKVCQIN